MPAAKIETLAWGVSGNRRDPQSVIMTVWWGRGELTDKA